jgi:hypothetical protein
MVTSVAPARLAFCRISMILPSSVPVKSLFAFDNNFLLTLACTTVSILKHLQNVLDGTSHAPDVPSVLVKCAQKKAPGTTKGFRMKI